MKSSGWVLLSGVVLLLAVVPRSFAEDKSDTLHEDKFAALDEGWDNDGNYLHVEHDKLVQQSAKPHWSWLNLYKAKFFDDMDASVDVHLVEGKDGDAAAGFAFWAPDEQNHYSVRINSYGKAAMIRCIKGRYLVPVTWREVDLLKKGPDAVNNLRVVTLGDSITVFINGKEWKTIKGEPPQGGGFIGVTGETVEKAPYSGEFSNLIIKKPSPKTTANAGDPPAKP
jgi:hypothetical protein